MKSKTSFFNGNILKKDILRYAPIWAGYTIFLLLVFFGMADRSTVFFASDVLDSLKAMSLLNLLYACICAAFLFMDLYNGRLCNALHAFPPRRECWLSTHILSGFLFSLIPNLLITLLGSVILWEYAYIAPIWLAVSTLQYLFFFGSAVLCMVCAGNLIGFAAMYGIFHAFTVIVLGVAETIYEPLLYSVQFDQRWFEYLFPIGQMEWFDYATFEIDNYVDTATFHGLIGADWLYVGLCAAAGVLCLVLAWLVYRRRQLETAGDLISLKKLSPVFLFITSVAAGTFLYLFSEAFFIEKSYLFLFLGLIIGFIACSMLLNRTLRVFTKKNLLSLGILIAVFAGSLGLTKLDPLGLTRYVPELSDIESATVYGTDKGTYYMPTSFSLSTELRVPSYGITDADEIENIRQFHEDLIQYRPGTENGTLCDVRIHYKLKNGKTITRYYEVLRSSELGKRAGEYFSDMRYIFEVNDPQLLYNAFESVSIDAYDGKNVVEIKLTDTQNINRLLDAIKADCESGDMAQNYAYHDKFEENYYLDFSLADAIFEQYKWSANRFHIRIWPDCVKTTECIRQILAEQENTES